MNNSPCPKHDFVKRISEVEFLCFICKTTGHGTRYQCSVCHLGVHEDCATPRLSSHRHPEHQLTLVYCTAPHCDICREGLLGPVYSCRECNFDAHSFCLGKPVVKEKLVELHQDDCATYYPAHLSSHHHLKHQLSFISGTRKSNRCDVCREVIRGRVYACVTCDFDVHPLCLAKPPVNELHEDRSITYPTQLCSHHHPNHQLTLKTSKSVKCDICKEILIGRVYACPECKIGFHSSCLSEPAVVKENVELPKFPAHLTSDHHPRHTLTHINGTRNSNRCDVCREVILGHVYACLECDFDVHPLCLVKPAVVKKKPESPQYPAQLTSDHHPRHTLTHINGTRNSNRCDVCREVIFGHVYACLECDFDFHPLCLVKPAVVKKKPESPQYPAQLTSDHHPRHTLTHINGTRNSNRCDVCREVIFGHVYACLECDFDFHPLCLLKPAVVKKKPESPPYPANVFSHHHRKHQLTLTSRNTSCDVCKKAIGGHIYTCLKCNFDVHPICLEKPVVKETSDLDDILKIGVRAVRIMSIAFGFPSF